MPFRHVAHAGALMLVLGALPPTAVYAVPYILDVWGRDAVISVSDSTSTNPDFWRYATADTNEATKFKSLDSIPSFNGVHMHFEDSFLGFGSIDVRPLPGQVIDREPHDLDAGNWAYAIALVDPSNTVRSFVQVRLAASGATTLDSSLALAAVASGAWSGVNDYIEFDPFNAYYSAQNTSISLPNSPADYEGFVFPEPNSAALAVGALTVLAAARRRV